MRNELVACFLCEPLSALILLFLAATKSPTRTARRITETAMTNSGRLTVVVVAVG